MDIPLIYSLAFLVIFWIGFIVGIFVKRPKETVPHKYFFGEFTGLQYLIHPRPFNSTKEIIEFYKEPLTQGEYQWPVIFMAQFFDIQATVTKVEEIEKEILDKIGGFQDELFNQTKSDSERSESIKES